MMESTPIIRGRVACYQPGAGYRFSVDSLLLPWFTARCREGMDPGCDMVELGSGSGVMTAQLLLMGTFRAAVAVELQEELARAGEATAEGNGLGLRMKVLNRDLRTLGRKDLPFLPMAAVSNPPFYPVNRGRIPPSESLAMARHEVSATMADVLEAGRRILADRGRLYLTYPVSRLQDLMVELPRHGFAPLKLQLVHPGLTRPANRFLCEAARLPAAGLEVLAPVEITGGGEQDSWYGELEAMIARGTGGS